MASYLQIENISKSYGTKVLFERIGFNINEGDKIALIAPNGAGKSTLLRILAGNEKSDSGGKITFLKDIRIAFLEQEYDFDPKESILERILRGRKRESDGGKAQSGNEGRSREIGNAENGHAPDEEVFAHELRVRKLLTGFGLEPRTRMGRLSGGEVKRVALTEMLASEADFYIMDEPTNHLDIDAIEFLENWLSHARCTLLMVTHDRYFLDSVCNTVMELDRGSIYTYKGDYANYLEKRQARIDNYNAETAKVNNLLRRELEWMHSSPCARTGKAKARKNAFYELKDRAEDVYRSDRINLEEMGTGSRLGSKIFNCKGLGFSYGERVLLRDFTYNFQRFERVGIVGKNGSGKSTFLNILCGEIPEGNESLMTDGAGQLPSSAEQQEKHEGGRLTGVLERGESLKIGYYKQGGMEFDEGQTVLETVNDTRLLNLFMFGHEMLSTKVERLSGGEKRRLYLLTVLAQKPNLLILDEPTNDLDIVTLNVLEEYLREFRGSLVIVSHDRHFLDRLVDHLFIFTGDGTVKDFIGSYSQYHDWLRAYEARQRAAEKSYDVQAKPIAARTSPKQSEEAKKRKLSFKEQRELEQVEKDLEAFGAERAELEVKLNSGVLPYNELQTASARYAELKDLLDSLETRWLELQLD